MKVPIFLLTHLLKGFVTWKIEECVVCLPERLRNVCERRVVIDLLHGCLFLLHLPQRSPTIQAKKPRLLGQFSISMFPPPGKVTEGKQSLYSGR